MQRVQCVCNVCRRNEKNERLKDKEKVVTKKKKIMNKKHKKYIFKSQRAKIKMLDLVKEFYFKGP